MKDTATDNGLRKMPARVKGLSHEPISRIDDDTTMEFVNAKKSEEVEVKS
jgi:hypothetical protein